MRVQSLGPDGSCLHARVQDVLLPAGARVTLCEADGVDTHWRIVDLAGVILLTGQRSFALEDGAGMTIRVHLREEECLCCSRLGEPAQDRRL